MSLVDKIVVYHEVARINNVPIRVSNNYGDFLGGIFLTYPLDTGVPTICVTANFMSFLDKDKDGFLAMVYHELGHIYHQHIDSSKYKVIQKEEYQADQYALQFVSVEALERGLKFGFQTSSKMSMHLSAFRSIVNKLELFFRACGRFKNIRKNDVPVKNRLHAWRWSDHSLAILAASDIAVPDMS